MVCHPFLRERFCVLLFRVAACRELQKPDGICVRAKQNPGRWAGAQNRMLHLSNVHRVLDVKRARHLCKVFNIARFLSINSSPG